MILESLLTQLGMESLKAGLQKLREKLSEKDYERLITAAVAELLKEHPDIDDAEAKILAAEATGANPTVKLLRAKGVLSKVKSYGPGVPSHILKKGAKKAARKTAVRGKYVSKKAARKTTGRRSSH